MNRFDSGSEPTIHGVDEKLASAAQQQVREAVRVLPEETLSMAWRSGLNEQISALSAKKARRRALDWVWKPALGAALTCSLAAAVLWKTEPAMLQPSDTADLGAAFMAAHQESSVAADVVGPGLAARDPQVVRSVNFSRDESWPEVDVNSL